MAFLLPLIVGEAGTPGPGALRHVQAGCSAAWANCQANQCCPSRYTCYEKDNQYAQCRPTGSCVPGVQPGDPVPTPWTCCPLPGGCPPRGCSEAWGACHENQCCPSDYTCYKKDHSYAQCRPTGQCIPGGIQPNDPIPTPWSCCPLPSGCSTLAPAPPPLPATTTTTTTMVPTTTTALTTTPCEDKNGSCSGWALIGECWRNPRYMLRFCPVSCGVCH